MDLKWWPVAVAGLCCLAICVALAALVPMRRVRRRLRPLAHVDRLTRLPEYANVVRMQRYAMLMLVALLVIVYLLALLTSSRPAGLATPDRGSVRPVDTMLCVGEPVTDPGTAGLLNYFARRAVGFTTQRIGLTSTSLRVVPLTRDNDDAADAFGRYAELTALQHDVDTNQPLTPGQAVQLSAGTNDFSRPLNYVDYARGTNDVLALCLAGFPAQPHNDDRRRSLIYLGPADLRRPDEQRPALFTTGQVNDMARAGGVQVNVITQPGPSPQADDLRSIAVGTAGTFETYDAAGTGADASGGTDAALAAILDRIESSPPPAGVSLRRAGAVADRSLDSPTVPLVAGIVVSALLCIALAVLRR